MLGNLTFCAEQRGGALQESPDLLQRSLFSASDAALGIMAAGQGGDLIEDDRKLWLVCQHGRGVEDKLDIRWFNTTVVHSYNAPRPHPLNYHCKMKGWQQTEV